MSFHNYLVKHPDSTTIVSVDVGAAINSGILSEDMIKYHGTNAIFFNGVCGASAAQNFCIRQSVIIAQWTSEKL